MRALTAASQWRSFREAFKWVAATRRVAQWVYAHLKPRFTAVVDHMTDNDRSCLQKPCAAYLLSSPRQFARYFLHTNICLR